MAQTTKIQRYVGACLLTSLLVLAGCSGDDPVKTLESAKVAVDKHDYSAAMIHIRNVLQKDQNNAEARFIFGKILFEQGDAAGAVNELRKALDGGYSKDLTLPLLINAMVANNQAKQVTDEFSNVAPLSTPDVQAQLLSALGRAYLTQGNTDKAVPLYDEALKIKPNLASALIGQTYMLLAAKKTTEALATIDKAVTENPTDIDALLLQGGMWVATGKKDEAIVVFEKVAKLAPTDYRPYVRLVSLYLSQGKNAEADKNLAELKRVAPNNLQTLYMDGLVSFNKGQFEAARDATAKVLRVAPDNVLTQMLAASTYIKLGEQLQAQLLLKKIISGQKDWDQPRKMLAESYIASRNPDDALGILGSLLSGNVQDPELLNLAGQAYMLKGDFSRSTDYFSRLATARPNSASARTDLGLARLAGGDELHGMQDLDVATKMDNKNAKPDLAMISAYLRKNDVQNALKAVAELEKKQPDSPLTYNVKGQVLLATKNAAQARVAFERAMQLQPDNLAAAIYLARLDIADQKMDVAKKRFEQIIEKNPKNVRAYLMFAEFQAETRAGLDAVIATLNKAIKADPTRNEARIALAAIDLNNDNKKEALDIMQQAQAAQPDDPKVLEVLGKAQLAVGEEQQAISTFQRLQNVQPENPMTWVNLADAQGVAKDLRAAEGSLRRALEMKANLPDALQRMTSLYLSQKRWDDAMKLAKRTQTSFPDLWVGYALESQVWAAQGGHWPEATAALTQAYQRNKSPMIVNGLHAAYIEMGKQAEAQQLVNDWFKSNPKDVIVHNYLAERALVTKQYSDAMAQYKIINELQPNSALVLNNIAWIAGQMKDPKALEYAEAALKIAPESPQVLETTGTLLVESGQMPRGVELLKKATELAPKSAVIRLGYARALLKSGDKSGAKKEVDTASQYAGENNDVRKQIDEMAKTL